MNAKNPQSPPAELSRRKLVWTFAALTLLLLAAGWWYYRAAATRHRQSKYEEIAAIGELKSGQIQQWRQGRLHDATRMDVSFVRKAVADFVPKPRGRARTELRELLKIERIVGGYADTLLFAQDGKLLLAAKDSPGTISPATQRVIAAALARREAVLSDLFRDSDGTIQLDVAAAVRDPAGEPLAVVVLRSDAASYLYPLIQKWPTPSRSAETFIVQRDGDSTLFLNEARHRTDTALILRLPLTRTDIPAVQAVLGRQGVFEGRDYRGVAVLSDLRPIPGSLWFMVAKVDADEILAEMRFRTGVIALVVGSLILLGAIATASIYRQQVATEILRLNAELERRVRDRTARLAESEDRFRGVVNFARDAIVSVDEKQRILLFNPAAERMFGHSASEMIGQSLERLIPPRLRRGHAVHFRNFAATGLSNRAGDGLATVSGLRAGGVEFPVELSISRTDTAGRGTFTAILRDVTERKRREEQLRKLSRCVEQSPAYYGHH